MDRDRPAIELRGITVSHGDVTALSDVDLTVAAGETVALIGPSGAGKTSLMRVMAGTLPPSAGEVHLFGTHPADARRGGLLPQIVGLMPQQLDLIPQLTVKHNIEAGALGRWGSVRSTMALILPLEHPSARTAAARVGIEGQFTQRTSRCSGGEQQRTALARLLVQDPRVLLVDEPVSSIDPARAEDLLTLLRRLADEDGRTLVASLHTPDLARRHLDRIVGLRHGRIEFDLPSAEVHARVLDDLYQLGREPRTSAS